MPWHDLYVKDSEHVSKNFMTSYASQEQEDVRILPSSTEMVIDFLPSAIILFVLLRDALGALPPKWPFRPLIYCRKLIARPFRDFMQLSDMAEYDPSHPVVLRAPQWKKWICVGLSSFAMIGWFIFGALNHVQNHHNELFGSCNFTYSLLLGCCWAYATLRIVFHPLHAAPVGNILFSFSQLIFAIVLLANTFLLSHQISPVATLLLGLSSLYLYISGTLPLSPELPSPTVSPPHTVPTVTLSSPEDSVSFLEWVTFSFPSLYYPISSKRSLEHEDVWCLSPRFLHANLFGKYLRYQKKIEAKKRQEKLIMFLLRANSADMILDIIIELYKAVAGFLPPYALKQLLAILANNDMDGKQKLIRAHYYALLTFVAHLSFAQCDLAQSWCTRRCYERTRGMIFCALHWKALRRRVAGGVLKQAEHNPENSDSSKQQESDAEKERSADLGKVVNLMQGDAYAVAQRFWELSPLFGAPVRIGVALWFLYSLLGTAAFAGVAVILFTYLINWPLMKINIWIARNAWHARDLRMNRVNELFQNVRFLKLMGWEGGWARRVLDLREKELRWRVKENVYGAVLVFIWTWVPSATVLSSFIVYTLVSAKPLTVSIAFTALGVFSQLQSSLSVLPSHIFALFHAYVSMQRINNFLEEENVPDWACSLTRMVNPPSDLEAAENIGFENASFGWHQMGGKDSTVPGPRPQTAHGAVIEDEDRHPRLDDGDPIPTLDEHAIPSFIVPDLPVTSNDRVSHPQLKTFKLQDLNVSLPPGKLTLVTGITGAGKTAFLVALLGEMQLLGGKIHLDKSNHKVAYCAQFPWLEHATIRDNITYGSPLGYDEERYDAVVAACALEKDLEILPAGDMTEIGEKGVSLSGGQRARVALARALYSPARVILLDDPLAAVDMHTARHLVQECLNGPLMKGRTVVFVTHHIRLCLPVASYLVELNAGRIERQGIVNDLQQNGDIDLILKHFNMREEDNKEKEHQIKQEHSDGDILPEGQTNVEAAPFISTGLAVEPNGADQQANLRTKESSKPKWRVSTAEQGKFIGDEARAHGRVSWNTYKTYIQAAGYWSWILTLFLMTLLRGVNILDQFFLSKWGEAYNHPNTNTSTSIVAILFFDTTSHQNTLPLPSTETYSASIPIIDDLPSPDQNVRLWLFIYFCISMLGAFTVLGYISLGYYASLQASRSLFKRMLLRLSRAPIRFFDTTPMGRILNRFAGDIGTVDGGLNNSARNTISGALTFISSFVVIVCVVPMFTPVAILIAWMYIRLAPAYVNAARDLRRLESIAMSPTFSGFDELLQGLIHVRAYGVERRYQERFYKRVDTFQAHNHSYWLTAFWLKYRYDCLGSVVVYLTTLFALTSAVSTGFAAIVILNAGVFAEASRQLVNVLAQLEFDFNSIERIGEYLTVSQEAPAIIPESRPPAYWPSSSSPSGIVVDNLYIRYSPTSPDVLHGISFTVRAGERIGVVGRTGSGKTTLCAAFLRVVEAWKGKIIIDGIDISTIGLEDLRNRVTLVSQDVALFEGSVRLNLDPFDEHSEEECWDVLKRCHLVGQETTDMNRGTSQIGTIRKRNAVFDSLDSPISSAGGSLSAGQRQLVALARALLRRSQVILTDEATSAIDLELDNHIQQTIREEMGGATVITIAHRLRTVIEYDRILVLSHGRIVEFDTPEALIRKPEGVFANMCRGSADWAELRRLVTG